MDRYFRVSPRIWDESWDDPTRLMALYLLTCRHRTTEGLFRLPRQYMVADLGWSKRKIETPLRKLESCDFIRTHGDVFLIVKALKRQAPRNPNQRVAAINAIRVVPATPLDQEFRLLAEQHAPLLAEQLAEQIPDRFGTNPDLLPHALALSSSSSSSSISTSSVGDDEGLKIFLKGEGIEDPEIELALNRLRLRRAGYGEPITDEAAWLLKVARSLDTERHHAQTHEQPAVVEIDGEKFRFVNGQWQVEPPA